MRTPLHLVPAVPTVGVQALELPSFADYCLEALGGAIRSLDFSRPRAVWTGDRPSGRASTSRPASRRSQGLPSADTAERRRRSARDLRRPATELLQSAAALADAVAPSRVSRRAGVVHHVTTPGFAPYPELWPSRLAR